MSSLTGASSKAPKGYSQYSLPTMEGGAHDLWSMLIGKLGPSMSSSMDNLGKLASGDESYFQQLEKPAMAQFQQGMGQLGSRFSQMAPGAMSSQKSSGFQLAGSGMAQDLAQRLQSNRMGLQQQAIRDLMGMSQNLMSMPTQQYGLVEDEEKSSPWKSIIGGSLPILGGVAGGIFGGPTGASLGINAGSAASKAFF